jgi:hypothetical protein
MSKIRPVLVVGAGDFPGLGGALRAHGFGMIAAPTLEEARTMLRHFRVDAVVTFACDPEGLAALAPFHTPVVAVSSDASRSSALNCAAFVAGPVELSALPGILRRVLGGERGQLEVRGAA